MLYHTMFYNYCHFVVLRELSLNTYYYLLHKGEKVKSLYLTSVVPSATRLVSMEADGAPFTPLYMDQRKVKTDVEVTQDRTRDFLL